MRSIQLVLSSLVAQDAASSSLAAMPVSPIARYDSPSHLRASSSLNRQPVSDMDCLLFLRYTTASGCLPFTAMHFPRARAVGASPRYTSSAWSSALDVFPSASIISERMAPFRQSSEPVILSSDLLAFPVLPRRRNANAATADSMGSPAWVASLSMADTVSLLGLSIMV